MNKLKQLYFLILLTLVTSCNEAGWIDITIPVPVEIRDQSSMVIHEITDNRQTYENGEIPAFEKFEITFQIEGTVAQNFQFPYDGSPPPGIDLKNPNYQGITVDAIFSPDNWETTYLQPAFYHQGFIQEIQGDREWYYPTDEFSWKIRFSPPSPGEWQYKLSAEDASGYSESPTQNFAVVSSPNPGFIRVSSDDSRYFEFEDGSYFPGLGYNLTSKQINSTNPQISSQQYFQKISKNGIELIRMWLPSWGIYTSAWNPWHSITPAPPDGYIPFTGLTLSSANNERGSETSMVVNTRINPCMFAGWLMPKPAVKPDTDYRIRVQYQMDTIEGPKITGKPYGLVAKMGADQNGGWLWGDGLNCNDPGTGLIVSPYQNVSTKDDANPWKTLEGSWNSGDNRFLPYFYLVLENVNQGRALIDYVWIEEVLPDRQFGPNILPRPWMSHHLYFEQRNSLAFDKVIEAAHQSNVYFKLVTLEKNEWTMNRIQFDGSYGDFGEGNRNFYGDWREITKVRWLQQAWWRYIQARWGYSPNIHSWELLNEGDPASDQHYALADEFGKYMHCEVFGISMDSGEAQKCTYEHPNNHLVTTSFWHSFPAKTFWASENYPNIDYADLHAYNSTGQIDNPAHEIDAALYHLEYSRGASRILHENADEDSLKPIMRGEAGIDFKDQQVEQPDLHQDKNGVWLHNFLWSSLDAGGLLEQYWWNENIENQPGPDEEQGLYEVFGYFYNFIENIPINNGLFTDSGATITNPKLRVIGQKDTTNNQAQIWVQHVDHTWRNVVDGIGLSLPISGNITMDGFTPNMDLDIEWHIFTTQGIPSIEISRATVNSDGSLIIELPNAPQITDIGILISPSSE